MFIVTTYTSKTKKTLHGLHFPRALAKFSTRHIHPPLHPHLQPQYLRMLTRFGNYDKLPYACQNFGVRYVRGHFS